MPTRGSHRCRPRVITSRTRYQRVDVCPSPPHQQPARVQSASAGRLVETPSHLFRHVIVCAHHLRTRLNLLRGPGVVAEVLQDHRHEAQLHALRALCPIRSACCQVLLIPLDFHALLAGRSTATGQQKVRVTAARRTSSHGKQGSDPTPPKDSPVHALLLNSNLTRSGLTKSRYVTGIGAPLPSLDSGRAGDV
jgi:hypothetical protein